MVHMLVFFSVLLLAGYSGGHQNLPPGVNPQHYQQMAQQVPVHHHMPAQHQMPVQQQVPMQQVPMQQQQVPMQQQQMPMQHQGVPVQQQGVPVQQQGVPVQQQGVPVQQQGVPLQQASHGHHHDGNPQVLNVGNLQHEKEHIQEHMQVPIDTSKMSEQELQFHYFKMHDADNNNKLDGCELIKSLIHWHEQGHAEPGKPPAQPKLFKDEELVSLIDPILALDDSNSDGYIDYPEFVRAQQKAASTQQQQQQQSKS